MDSKQWKVRPHLKSWQIIIIILYYYYNHYTIIQYNMESPPTPAQKRLFFLSGQIIDNKNQKVISRDDRTLMIRTKKLFHQNTDDKIAAS